MANTKILKEQLEFNQSDGAVTIPVTTANKDFSVTVNDGGVTRTAIQVNGDEGSVTMPRQSGASTYTTVTQTIATGN
jgi:hypothetical protein